VRHETSSDRAPRLGGPARHELQRALRESLAHKRVELTPGAYRPAQRAREHRGYLSDSTALHGIT
jgi:hypothetical protein